MGIVHYDTGGERLGLQMLYSIPIYNADRTVKFVIEYIRDISIQEQFDQQVSQLQAQIDYLEEKNAILAEALVEREEVHHRSEESLVQSIKKLAVPPPRNKVKSSPKMTLLPKIPTVDDSPLSINGAKLSKREAQICRMILEGLTSKEIAEQLFVSQKTVDFHRTNIRNKLQIEKGTSLISYLRIERHKLDF